MHEERELPLEEEAGEEVPRQIPEFRRRAQVVRQVGGLSKAVTDAHGQPAPKRGVRIDEDTLPESGDDEWNELYGLFGERGNQPEEQDHAKGCCRRQGCWNARDRGHPHDQRRLDQEVDCRAHRESDRYEDRVAVRISGKRIDAPRPTDATHGEDDRPHDQEPAHAGPPTRRWSSARNPASSAGVTPY